MRPTIDSTGIIGLGIIGSRAAENLRKADKHVYVWSPTPRPVPNFLGGPAEIASFTKTIQLFVRDSAALLEVTGKLLPKLTHEHVIINCATVSPEATEKAAQAIQATAAAFLDCPFTGSKEAAGNGDLVYYVGGNKGVLERVRPLLEITSKEIIHLGEIGHATVIKIATNMVSATTVAALSEALAVTRANGISGEKLLRAIQSNACGSGVANLKLPAIMEGDFSAHFSLKNMLKDARYGLGLGKDSAQTLPVLAQVAGLMETSENAGRGEDDFCVLSENYPDTHEK